MQVAILIGAIALTISATVLLVTQRSDYKKELKSNRRKRGSKK